MSKPTIAKRGPFFEDVTPGTYWWCACGKSKKQPFCDGSHQGSDFSPVKIDVTESKTLVLCGCKHSANKPFCDGSHGSLK
ncbi:MAG: CDGSH iron-sulfur domain-containing protein [Gammaproteobacteria bacterium]|nr:CDGSH iron-sulfur domain-containing protein [Gammaproteobacteria bacterium]MDH5693897.1 CDGSH iron-sulfur domain-containing protein [Gammaproteobacteria bacterium]